MFDQMKLIRLDLRHPQQVQPAPARGIVERRAGRLSSEQPRVKIRVPSPGGLRYLLSPSLDNLGEAYVEGAHRDRRAARPT